jgi:hypothetical protein
VRPPGGAAHGIRFGATARRGSPTGAVARKARRRPSAASGGRCGGPAQKVPPLESATHKQAYRVGARRGGPGTTNEASASGRGDGPGGVGRRGQGREPDGVRGSEALKRGGRGDDRAAFPHGTTGLPFG